MQVTQIIELNNLKMDFGYVLYESGQKAFGYILYYKDTLIRFLSFGLLNESDCLKNGLKRLETIQCKEIEGFENKVLVTENQTNVFYDLKK